MSICSSIVDHAPNVDASVLCEFRGEHLLAIAVVPRVATLPLGEQKKVARGDRRPGWMFLLLDTVLVHTITSLCSHCLLRCTPRER